MLCLFLNRIPIGWFFRFRLIILTIHIRWLWASIDFFATRKINTKMTLSWAQRQFATRVHTLFSMSGMVFRLDDVDDLRQDFTNSSALAMELLQSCIKSYMWFLYRSCYPAATILSFRQTDYSLSRSEIYWMKIYICNEKMSSVFRCRWFTFLHILGQNELLLHIIRFGLHAWLLTDTDKIFKNQIRFASRSHLWTKIFWAHIKCFKKRNNWKPWFTFHGGGWVLAIRLPLWISTHTESNLKINR